MRAWFTFLVLMLLSGTGHAQSLPSYQANFPTGITNIAMNATATARTTLNMQVSGFPILTLQTTVVTGSNSSLTGVTLQCYGSLDNIVFGAVQTVKLSSGAGTLSDYILTKNVTANSVNSFVVNLGINYRAYRCTVNPVGTASASDRLTVVALAGTEGP